MKMIKVSIFLTAVLLIAGFDNPLHCLPLHLQRTSQLGVGGTLAADYHYKAGLYGNPSLLSLLDRSYQTLLINFTAGFNKETINCDDWVFSNASWLARIIDDDAYVPQSMIDKWDSYSDKWVIHEMNYTFLEIVRRNYAFSLRNSSAFHYRLNSDNGDRFTDVYTVNTSQWSIALSEEFDTKIRWLRFAIGARMTHGLVTIMDEEIRDGADFIKLFPGGSGFDKNVDYVMEHSRKEQLFQIDSGLLVMNDRLPLIFGLQIDNVVGNDPFGPRNPITSIGVSYDFSYHTEWTADRNLSIAAEVRDLFSKSHEGSALHLAGMMELKWFGFRLGLRQDVISSGISLYLGGLYLEYAYSPLTYSMKENFSENRHQFEISINY